MLKSPTLATCTISAALVFAIAACEGQRDGGGVAPAAKVQSDLAPSLFSASADGSFALRRPSNGIRARAHASGLTLESANGDLYQVTLRTRSPRAAGSSVSLRDGVVVRASGAPSSADDTEEWYAPHQAGVEHGYTIRRTPDGPSTRWSARIEVFGLRPELQGKHVALIDESGRHAMSYGGLSAKDAQGRELPSELTVDGNDIAIDVDVTAAQYPVTVDPLVWGVLQATLTPSDSLATCFGRTSTIDGDTAVMADPCQMPGLVSLAGALYVYTRSAGVWTFQAKLVNAAPVSAEQLGMIGVALRGDVLIASGKSRSFVFVRSGTTWTNTDTLAGTGFLAYDGTTALINQCAYLVSSGKLTPQSCLPFPSTEFPGPVGVSGDTAIIGSASTPLPGKSGVGSAYIFTRSGATWSQQAQIFASDAAACSGFGAATAISGDTVIVGSSPGSVCGGGVAAAYAFVRSGTTWTQQAELEKGNSLGLAAIDGDNALLGTGSAPGILTRSGTTWTAPTHLPPSAAGSSGGISGGTALLGQDIYVVAKGVGDSCSTAGECITGFCVDGFCCDSSCDGPCQACSAAKKGAGADGTCGGFPDGSVDARCAALGSCRSSPTGTSAAYVTAWQCTAGTCAPKTSVSCEPYACTLPPATPGCATSCATNNDCAPDAYCDGSTCKLKAALGASCTRADGCASGFCAGGVCCATACDGQCESCDAKGSCNPVKGAPPTGKPACGATSGECGPACDGVNRTACTTPASGTACNGGCKNAALSTCDGAGACVSNICPNNYACSSASACATTCAGDADCAPGYGCAAGRCAPKSTKCSADRSASVDSTGASHPCSPILCDVSSGICGSVCRTNLDCSSGLVCESNGQCQTAVASSSGSCALGGRQRDTSAIVLWWVLGLIATARTRASRRS